MSTNCDGADEYGALVELKVLAVPVIVVPRVAADALLVYTELTLDCSVLKYVTIDPAVGAAIPVPEPDWCVLTALSLLINVAHCVAVTMMPGATAGTATTGTCP